MTKKTSLYDVHCDQGALIVDFAGFSMPLHYGSQIEEHHQVRNDAGVFDVSHMSSIDIKGKDAKKFLKYLLANDIEKLKYPGKALYGCMLNEQGGILDDLITYFIEKDYYRLVVNAATKESDFAWINDKARDFEVSLTQRNDLSMLAIQGPHAFEKSLDLIPGIDKNLILDLNYFSCIEHNSWFIARTGYTGEDGIEIILPNTNAPIFWKKLTEAGIKPIGLGARDTLRLEAGLNLYGTDMDKTVSPLESNLAWTVSLKDLGRSFIGRKAIEEQKQAANYKKLIGIVLEDKGVLRGKQKVFSNDKEIGIITSGSFSPTLKQSIAFARVDGHHGDELLVEIRGKKLKAKKVKLPFVKK